MESSFCHKLDDKSIESSNKRIKGRPDNKKPSQYLNDAFLPKLTDAKSAIQLRGCRGLFQVQLQEQGPFDSRRNARFRWRGQQQEAAVSWTSGARTSSARAPVPVWRRSRSHPRGTFMVLTSFDTTLHFLPVRVSQESPAAFKVLRVGPLSFL
jgi:hypothetical protein